MTSASLKKMVASIHLAIPLVHLLDGGDGCSVLVTGHVAHVALAGVEVVHAYHRMVSANNQVVTRWVKRHAFDVLHILSQHSSLNNVL